MGFMDTVKGWFNIGGVKVKLDVGPTVSRTGTELPGKVTLTSKGEKHVLKLTYKLVEEITTGRGDDEETKEVVLGQSMLSEEFDMTTGETKTLDFNINYAIQERLADKKGALGAVGKLGAFASAQKIKYYVVAECDVKGTALDPSDKKEIKVTE